jgi:hypothetical protein
MKRYRVPVDLFVMAEDVDAVERRAYAFMKSAQRDIGPQYNLSGFIFPVGYPTEEEPYGTTT